MKEQRTNTSRIFKIQNSKFKSAFPNATTNQTLKQPSRKGSFRNSFCCWLFWNRKKALADFAVWRSTLKKKKKKINDSLFSKVRFLNRVPHQYIQFGCIKTQVCR